MLAKYVAECRQNKLVREEGTTPTFEVRHTVCESHSCRVFRVDAGFAHHLSLCASMRVAALGSHVRPANHAGGGYDPSSYGSGGGDSPRAATTSAIAAQVARDTQTPVGVVASGGRLRDLSTDWGCGGM